MCSRGLSRDLPLRPVCTHVLHVAAAQVRQDMGIGADCKLEILAAEQDMYVSRSTGSKGTAVLKLGPKYDMGSLVPDKTKGWVKAVVGKDWAVWTKMHEEGDKKEA